MTATLVGLVVFAVTFGGVLVGMALARALPKHHLSDPSKDAIKVGIGLIATMSALVLGLVTASAKSAYDAVDTGLRHSAAQVLALDRVLARYGPDADDIRRGLRDAVGARLQAVWPESGTTTSLVDPLQSGVAVRTEKLGDAVRALAPRDDMQRGLQAEAVQLVEGLLQARWISLSNEGVSVPVPFLVVLVFWLAVTFTSFGLFAPPNATVTTVLFVCAMSVSSAIFLVLEMESPFSGLLKVPPTALERAYERLGR